MLNPCLFHHSALTGRYGPGSCFHSQPQSGLRHRKCPVSCFVAFKKEADLAALVVQYLDEEGWEVYQEVEPRRWGSTADIVAVQGHIVWVIECKLSMSMDLLGQAMEWKGYAHRVSVAVPAPKNNRHNTKRDVFIHRVCLDYGIGWFEVEDNGYSHGVRERVRAGFNRRLVDSRIKDSLTEKHKTYAKAGNAERRRWTPFMHTCDQVSSLVRQRPGITLKEIVDAVDHHYASDSGARSSLAHWIQNGKVKGVESRRDGRHLRFYAVPLKDS